MCVCVCRVLFTTTLLGAVGCYILSTAQMEMAVPEKSYEGYNEMYSSIGKEKFVTVVLVGCSVRLEERAEMAKVVQSLSSDLSLQDGMTVECMTDKFKRKLDISDDARVIAISGDFGPFMLESAIGKLCSREGFSVYIDNPITWNPKLILTKEVLNRGDTDLISRLVYKNCPKGDGVIVVSGDEALYGDKECHYLCRIRDKETRKEIECTRRSTAQHAGKKKYVRKKHRQYERKWANDLRPARHKGAYR